MSPLLSYWGKHPPTHILMRAFLFGGKKKGEKRVKMTREDLAAMFPKG